ncbi:hypothetical protein BDN72DRAFT_907140 [Pluteus cervinus]|uniref:Uncharacterized protein n=1 Tax=Pluteus cervinus TaxID=181527 RepID=A0ACD2ZX91_9AGAR|nr:hypothetical protein BDN72DRAFT_907140 [Pluteus cervinus]
MSPFHDDYVNVPSNEVTWADLHRNGHRTSLLPALFFGTSLSPSDSTHSSSRFDLRENFKTIVRIVEPDQQRLIFAGKQLEDGRNLSNERLTLDSRDRL